MSTPLESRWYAQLLAPVHGTVNAALAELGAEAVATPRAGLAGAMALHIARSYGRDRGRRARRAAVTTLELYNHRLHLELPTPSELAPLHREDTLRCLHVWERALRSDEPLFGRVMDRLLGSDARVVDRPIPEAVLFLRAAVAAGVLLGDVDDALHADLDRCATWLGLAWEAQHGQISPEGWTSALASVALPTAPLPSQPSAHAEREASQVLGSLPPSALTDALTVALQAGLATEPPAPRLQSAWKPATAPHIARRPACTSACGAVGEFQRTWSTKLEGALGDLMCSGSRALTDATEYLLEQGGKRVRPLLTLAVADACGGVVDRALPAAAAVEWLHQASLVVDDILDEATLRRGQPALHSATSKPFAAGAAAFYFARILRRLGSMHPAIRKSLVYAGIGLAEGERLELQRTGDWGLDLTTYYRIIDGKTARLFSCAATVGALSVEAPKSVVRSVGRLGRELGLAFQVVDDLLDYIGHARELGKEPGTDLRARKGTLPVLLLREELHGDNDAFEAAFAAGDLSWFRARFAEHEVEARCRRRAEEHLRRAQHALGALQPGAGREVLSKLISEGWRRRS